MPCRNLMVLYKCEQSLMTPVPSSTLCSHHRRVTAILAQAQRSARLDPGVIFPACSPSLETRNEGPETQVPQTLQVPERLRQNSCKTPQLYQEMEREQCMRK